MAYALDGAKAHLIRLHRLVDHGQQFGRQVIKIELLAHTRRERFDRLAALYLRRLKRRSTAAWMRGRLGCAGRAGAGARDGVEGMFKMVPLYVIPEGAGTVNGSCGEDVWVLRRFLVVGGRPSAR